MDVNARSGLRELQIGRGLVTLRWAAIPILLGFSLLVIEKFSMAFTIDKIFLLACLLALINVGFTVHIAMLTRQLALHRGTAALHRFLTRLLFHTTPQVIGQRGLIGILSLPGILLRVGTCLYLLMLEAFRRLRVNPLSTKNVTHGQVISDLASLLLFVRFTGSTESPLPVLMAVPVVVAGAVLGFQHGLAYATFAALGYFGLGLLINQHLISHIKFYGPQVGDLSQSLGWTVASALMLLTALVGVAYLAHHLTAVFRERIFYLNQLLERARGQGLIQGMVAAMIDNGYLVIDEAGTVLAQKADQKGLIPAGIVGRNLYEAVPSFKQGGLAYVVQTVIATGARKDLDRFRFVAAEGTSHFLDLRIVPMPGTEGRPGALLMIGDTTDLLFLQERLEEVRRELETGQTEFNRASFELKETNDQLMRSLKLANDRSIEIERLTGRIAIADQSLTEERNRVTQLAEQLARARGENDSLASDLGHRQLIIEEMSDLLRTCTHLDQLVATIERHTRTMFKLDNTCLHVFVRPGDAPERVRELLAEPKASPKLLDLPRKNPRVLDPLLKEGRPVLIKAALRPDQASMQIQDGPTSRLIAYIPVRDGDEVLGMMMLERYGPEQHHERMLEALVFYLNHTATAIRNAIAVRQLTESQISLRQELTRQQANLHDFITLLTSSHSDRGNWQAILRQMVRLSGSSDALLVRFRHDGEMERLGRVDGSRPPEPDRVESQLIDTLKRNPTQVASYQDPDGTQSIRGFPLNLDQRCLGVMVLADGPNQDRDATELLPLLAAMVADWLALSVLREEKELWESFYSNTLRA